MSLLHQGIILLRFCTDLCILIEQFDGLPLQSEVPVGVLDDRQLVAVVRDHLQVAALGVEVNAGKGLDLAVPLDRGQIYVGFTSHYNYCVSVVYEIS